MNLGCIDGNTPTTTTVAVSNYGEYDFLSVIRQQFAFSTGCPTMTCLPGYEFQNVMGQRDYLSDGDIEVLQ